MRIEDNTVPADNQMIGSSYVSFLGSPNAKKRILVVGNSITRHGPNKEIGWERDWGMAASAPEKDYVHRLYDMLTADGQEVFMRVSQCASWEMNFRNEEDNGLSNNAGDREFSADLVVFCLGENVKKEDKPYFKEPLKQFIDHICPNGKVIFSTCFWKNAIIDDIIKEVALERKAPCIDRFFADDEKNMAIGLFEHEGVAGHPGDLGMEKIAQTIFNQIKKMEW